MIYAIEVVEESVEIRREINRCHPYYVRGSELYYSEIILLHTLLKIDIL